MEEFLFSIAVISMTHEVIEEKQIILHGIRERGHCFYIGIFGHFEKVGRYFKFKTLTDTFGIVEIGPRQ